MYVMREWKDICMRYAYIRRMTNIYMYERMKRSMVMLYMYEKYNKDNVHGMYVT